MRSLTKNLFTFGIPVLGLGALAFTLSNYPLLGVGIAGLGGISIFLGFDSWKGLFFWPGDIRNKADYSGDPLMQAYLSFTSTSTRQRISDLSRKFKWIKEIYSRNPDRMLAENNLQALDHLAGIYVRLLQNKQDINIGVKPDDTDIESELYSRIISLKNELQSKKLSQQLRESKAATLSLYIKRYNVIKKRDEINREIDSDLARIEAQFDLALETAALKPSVITASISVASDLMMNDLAKELSSDVSSEIEPPVDHFEGIVEPNQQYQ